MISLSESLRIIQDCASGLLRASEKIAVREALHRVTATPLFARKNSPSQNVAAMDGIAVDFRTVTPAARLQAGHWQRISTGQPIPPYWNAVVRIEEVQWDKDCAIAEKPVEFMQNIRGEGEDFTNGRLLLPAFHSLQPQDLSLLLSAGAEEVDVLCKPVVTFVPTGSELIVDARETKEGGVLETNSLMISGLVEHWGGILVSTKPVEDDAQVLAQKIKTCASKTDVLVISAGTSKGIRDLTAKAIEEASGKILFHGVAIQPGKPVLVAEVNDVPIVGLPGYAAAAFVSAHLFLRPLVTHLSGMNAELPRSNYISAEDLPARPVDSFHRIQLYDVDGQVYARRIKRGASSLVSLSEMDGLMHVPTNVAIKKRDAVRVDVLHDRAKNTTVITGVEDRNTKTLFDFVREMLPNHRLLFFEATSEQALQSIVERNSHLAIISTPEGGVDIFSSYSKQLQEPQLRYRLFTRAAGLILSGSAKQYANLSEVPMAIRLIVPSGRLPLWDQFRFAMRLDELKFRPEFGTGDENSLTSALNLGQWDAVFADIRFMKEKQYCIASVREHVDLIVPESFSELDPVKKLIEFVLSDAFRKCVAAEKGCDPSTIGLL